MTRHAQAVFGDQGARVESRISADPAAPTVEVKEKEDANKKLADELSSLGIDTDHTGTPWEDYGPRGG